MNGEGCLEVKSAAIPESGTQKALLCKPDGVAPRLEATPQRPRSERSQALEAAGFLAGISNRPSCLHRAAPHCGHRCLESPLLSFHRTNSLSSFKVQVRCPFLLWKACSKANLGWAHLTLVPSRDPAAAYLSW